MTQHQKLMHDEVAASSRQLEQLSRVDALTDLFNRRHFHEYLRQVWRRAQSGRDDVAIIMLDIDHFKKFNDRYGHQAGDVCLAAVAKAVKDTMRQPGDLAARLGGEEIIAVLPQTGLATARVVAERIRHAVQALQLRHEASSVTDIVTVSVGVASWTVQAVRSMPHSSQRPMKHSTGPRRLGAIGCRHRQRPRSRARTLPQHRRSDVRRRQPLPNTCKRQRPCVVRGSG